MYVHLTFVCEHSSTWNAFAMMFNPCSQMPPQSWSLSSSPLTTWNMTPSLKPCRTICAFLVTCIVLCFVWTPPPHVSPLVSQDALWHLGTENLAWAGFIAKTANNGFHTDSALNDKDLDNFPWSHNRCTEWPGIKSKPLDFPRALFMLCHCQCQQMSFKYLKSGFGGKSWKDRTMTLSNNRIIL